MSTRATSSDGGGYRYLALAEMLEKDIEAGKYGIGAKLPSERFLAKELNVSHLTVRQGVEILARKGLVRKELGSGTYVNATKADPIIGILFGPSLVEESAHFYRALLKALEGHFSGMSYTCRSYDGFNRTDAGSPEDSLPYQQLLRDTHSTPVRGFIKVSMADERWDSLKPIKGVPFASHGVMSKDVMIDGAYFGRQSLELCVERGCKDIVYLRNAVDQQRDLAGMADAVKRLKTTMPEIVDLKEDGLIALDVAAHDIVLRLTDQWRDAKRRPDALIVADDIATRGVAIALIKAGIKVPSEMLLVTMANEGINHHYGLDVIRYYLSSREIARKLVDVLSRRMKRGKASVPQIVEGGWQESLLPPINGKRSALVS